MIHIRSGLGAVFAALTLVTVFTLIDFSPFPINRLPGVR